MHWCPHELILIASALTCLGCAKAQMRMALSRLSERVRSIRPPWMTLADAVTFRPANATEAARKERYDALIDSYGPKGRKESS